MTFGTISLIITSILWGVVHSVLASHTVKGWMRRAVGISMFDRLYRFAYNVFALSSLYPIAAMLYTFADRPLYKIPSPWVYIAITVQALAAMILISSIVQTGVADFLGLGQWYNLGESKPATLMTHGWYAIVRHPLYLGILMFAWLIPEMTVNRLAVLATFTIYIVLGAWFEERKLLKDFDPAYAEYKAHVPMFFPRIW